MNFFVSSNTILIENVASDASSCAAASLTLSMPIDFATSLMESEVS